MFRKKHIKPIISVMLAISTAVGGTTALAAAEKGVVQVFKPNSHTIEKTQELIDNREWTQRSYEYLDRGLIAAKCDDGIFVSWRWLGTESNETKYNLYRDGELLNVVPMNVTNFTDVTGTTENKYSVAAVIDGVEQEKCGEVTPWEDNKLEIPLTDKPTALNPDGTQKYADDGVTPVTYEPTETSIADLDGDGQLEIVLKWDPTDRCDNSVDGITSPCILDAYKLDGTKMWRINLGYNIRSGSHYTQFMVYDFDGDGQCEMICKTADGTTDNAGNVVGDKNKLWRNSSGRILDGPEYVTAFDAVTGEIIDTTDYIPARGTVSDWGDDYGNRVDRFLACVAYLDGERPSYVTGRGYYTRMAITAYNLVDDKLEEVWAFDTDKNNGSFMGQGNHSIAAADVDIDGKDEIIYGGAVIDHDGTGLYSTGLGHGDAQHTGDLIPSRPGLEIFSVHEEKDAEFGVEMRDARTGEIIWGSYENDDVGRGVSDDIDPNYPGAESWSSERKMISSEGEIIYENPSIAQNFLIYWDGDLGREIQDSNHIDKWVPEKNKTQALFTAKGYESNNGTKATPGITCDMFGDWREETILFKSDDSAMAIFTTTTPTDYKIYTLMHDLQYRTYICTQNVGYNQPPHLGYYLGFDTTEIPVSRVKVTHDGETYSNPDLENGTKYYSIDSLKRDESVSMVIDKPYAEANGAMVSIDAENSEVVPFIKNDRTLVPLRFIAEAFGAEVEWDGDKKEITIVKDDKTIKMNIGKKPYTINGKAYRLDAAPAISSDRTFVPLRAVAEALDKKVAYDASGAIYISDNVEEISAEQAEIICERIGNYVAPIVETTAPAAIDAKQLNEKQIAIYAVDATSNDGNTPEGAVDGDFSTRWNAFGDGEELWVDFNEVKDVTAVAASFFKGYERQYYFDIAVSEDGENWTTVLTDCASSGDTEEGVLEMFKFPETVKARYLKYIGHGSSTNDANNVWELVILAP